MKTTDSPGQNQEQLVQDLPSWSKELVLQLLLNSRSIRLYAAAPYLSQLYRDDIRQSIQYPADIVEHHCSPPLRIEMSGKPYFIPGSADDLILYSSCLAACAEAILRSLPIGKTEDIGPPFSSRPVGDVFAGQSSLRSAWRHLNTIVRQKLKSGHTVVITDIASCASNIDLDRLHGLLLETNADRSAIKQLHKMHQFWQHSGCQGLPLSGGFCLLLKIYLAEVDNQLRRHEIDFLRIQDDFRIFSLSCDDAVKSFEILQKSLSNCYMRVNQAKTSLLKPKACADWLVHRQAIKHVLSDGIGLPLLCEMLQFSVLRPMVLLLLRRFYSHLCKPIAIMNSSR